MVRFSQPLNPNYLVDGLSQDVLHRRRSPLTPPISNLQRVLVCLRRHSHRLLQLAQLLVRNLANLPQLAVLVSAPNNCRCSGIKSWRSNYCQKTSLYPQTSSSNSSLHSKPNDLLQRPKLSQPLTTSSNKRPKLEAVQLGKIRVPQSRDHGTTLSCHLTNTCLPPSVTQITGSEVEGP